MLQHADVAGDYEIWPGRLLLDTTPEERLMTAQEWSQRMQESRLAYMGLQTHRLTGAGAPAPDTQPSSHDTTEPQ